MPSAEAKAAAVAAMVEAEKNPAAEVVEEEGVIPLPDTSESTETAEVNETAEKKEPAKAEKEADEETEEEPGEDPEKPPPTAEEKRKELAAERLAKALKRDERSVQRELNAKQMEQEAARIVAEAKADRDEVAALKARLKDPTTRIAALTELGVTYEDHTRAYLNGSKRTPEDDIKELRESVEQDKQRLAKEREDIARERASQAMQAELVAAANVVDANPDKYPILYSEHTPSQIQEKFAEAWGFIRQENAKRLKRGEQEKFFSHEELASILENELKPEYDVKKARREKLNLTGSEVESASGKPAGKVITSDLSSGSSARILTKEERRAQAIKML